MTINPRLPGADLVIAGVRDLTDERVTVEGLLVLIATPRLTAAGIDVPRSIIDRAVAGLELYRLLAKEHGDEAHFKYNVLIQRLVSFECALEVEQAFLKARASADQAEPG